VKKASAASKKCMRGERGPNSKIKISLKVNNVIKVRCIRVDI